MRHWMIIGGEVVNTYELRMFDQAKAEKLEGLL